MMTATEVQQRLDDAKRALNFDQPISGAQSWAKAITDVVQELVNQTMRESQRTIQPGSRYQGEGYSVEELANMEDHNRLGGGY